MFITPKDPSMKILPKSGRQMIASRNFSRGRLAISAVSALMLAACGGGGGGGTPAAATTSASPLSFPLKSAYATLVASGYSKSYSISGTCSGTATETVGPAVGGASFEGSAGVLAASHTQTVNFTNCTPASSAVTGTGYWDSNYNPLGTLVVGSLYRVYPTPISIPASVTVGSTGTLGTGFNYANSSKGTPTGQIVISYVIEPDTASSAIVNLIGRTFDTQGRLTSTEQDRYRITATGAATPVSIDIQYALTSTTHLFLQ